MTTQGRFAEVSDVLAGCGLNTVCESALCPNKHACYRDGTATFMILGETCTRHCAFCAVSSGNPMPPDEDEPARVAAAARKLNLAHVVVTSVTRDDLEDGGASMFARTIRAIRKQLPRSTIEVLTPDFKGCVECVSAVVGARPHVFNHNIETVRRLQKEVRPDADYERSLHVLHAAGASAFGAVVKSGIMVGLGEADAELFEAMADLRSAGCDILTIGQYLSPSTAHVPVERYVDEDTFSKYGEKARSMGFKAVAAGPFVRSSYRAKELLESVSQ